MKLYLIRHGQTKGNLEKRYQGKTDEGLCREGADGIKRKLAEGVYTGIEESELVFVSPMRRCRETAGILLPGREYIPVPAFREIDFGLFEGRNYRELSGDASYQAWIDSNGRMPFPGGESRETFRDRCLAGLEQVKNQVKDRISCGKEGGDGTDVTEQPVVTLVVHGGTIMSLLSTLGEDRGDFYDFQCENGGGYLCRLTAEENISGRGSHDVLRIIRRIL